ncbi:Ribosomal RNA small subunit methyltransferase F [Babesia microti strain RI]|uniref:Ribosomal RNA small subunit methyltransferase F n=1 Tax=Babesia microti (strain RI) TaxID=1133968 RepID=I7J8B2_BABMR|nr:Ribosomal RNA small subunit methyltransferase F [Babesia microti strain RI]CCF72769.1 Ribosomal RNA small subunit methyltransferase F [Babesia microti strain RI]|eukprot:XP_012647378.1 Ribosomal RNA small subunit methyltransferase F [Babesia microti strain RI]
MNNEEAFRRYLQDNNIPANKYFQAYNKVAAGLKPRYFRFPHKNLTYSFGLTHKRVLWLRDVELFAICGKKPLPRNAVGLDAASAAAVEALRLSVLAKQAHISILDMCCAPGGKLLAIASTLIKYITTGDAKVTIVGLDSSYRRLKVCNALLRKEGLPSEVLVKLICTDSTNFDPSETFKNIIDNKDCTVPCSYDRVIVDVECSHEGSLRSVLRTVKYWGARQFEYRWLNQNYIDDLVETQCMLLNKALDLCKPGGMVVYSTCSLIDRENQGVIKRILNQRSDVYAHPLPIRQCECCTVATNATKNEFEHFDWPAEGVDIKSEYRYGDFRLDSEGPCKNDSSGSFCAVLFNALSETSTTDGQFIASLLKQPKTE